MAATKKTAKKSASKSKKVVAESVELEVSSVTINAPEVLVSGGIMKDKVVPFLVALVVIGAFAVGLLYGKVSVYEDGVVAGVGTGGSGQAAAPAEDLPSDYGEGDAPIALDDEQWQQLLANPVAELGDPDAPVTMVEFTDYQCPFCARYYSETSGQLIADYVDTGQVRYIFRDLPLSFHQNAKPAAIAARCAGDQGDYMGMHDALFDSQDAWSGLSDPRENFVSLAGDVGLDTAAFEACYDGGEYDEAVDEEMALAASVGATGTPTFYIEGTQIVGAQPYAAFQQALDEALGE